VIKCYQGRATDAAFLNSGGAFVTTGSPDGDAGTCVRAWDTLLPSPNVWNCETSDGMMMGNFRFVLLCFGFVLLFIFWFMVLCEMRKVFLLLLFLSVFLELRFSFLPPSRELLRCLFASQQHALLRLAAWRVNGHRYQTEDRSVYRTDRYDWKRKGGDWNRQ
jgi:hypothetical protein